MRQAQLAVLGLILCACATRPAPPPADLPETLLSVPIVRSARLFATPNIRPQAAPRIDLAIPEHPSIRGALAYFTTELRSDIQQSLVRSAQYRKLIDRALDEYKLPKALAYLPVIESAYLPTLTSRAGAHGIWQFMPETAREYGLRVDWWIDERADPDQSTRAAAAYLSDLYREFHDWPLALAAYNAGPRRIHRALEETGTATFWDLLERSAIPRETRGYVPTFFAAITIASDPASYGFQLHDPGDPDVKRVEVEGPLSLRFIAAVTGIDEAILRDLNPALRHGIVPPGRATIRVPSSTADVALKNNDPNVAVCAYNIRDGDTVKKLAKKLRVKSETILAMNGLRAKSHLHRGQSIYLPVRARELSVLLSGVRNGHRPMATGGM
jgi:membrane-bound lytic murein transglycosylase D